MVVDGKKRCARCRQAKPISAFNRKSGRDGYASQCRPCRKITRAAAHKIHVAHEPARRKRCVRCGKTKKAAAFYRCTTARAGLSSQCRTCDAARRKERYPERGPVIRATMRRIRARDPKGNYAKLKAWRAANWEYMLAYERERFRKNYPTRGHLFRAKRQLRIARERGLPATLTEQEWRAIIGAFDGLCAYCRKKPWSHYEHVVPVVHGGGLTKENIVPACGDCNKSKGARSFEDFCASKGYDPAAIRARAAAPFLPARAAAA